MEDQFTKIVKNQLGVLVILSVIIALSISSCTTETAPKRFLQPATSIVLYSEFPQQEDELHLKLYDYFNLQCQNGSSMSVVTPLHLLDAATDAGFERKKADQTQYKIVIGNNVFGNTIYYSDVKARGLARDMANILNDFLDSYDLEYAQSINNVVPFNAHYLDHASYLTNIANAQENIEDNVTTFKIGIDHTLNLQEKTRMVVNLVVYLAQTLGSDCLDAIPNTSDLKFSMEQCNCPSKGRNNQLKSVEDAVDWLM